MSSTVIAIAAVFYSMLLFIFVIHGMDGVDTFLNNVTAPFVPVHP
jgi:hypothetical protein